MVQFRKSKKFGPFRLTATKTGLSLSGGVPGARVSMNTRGEVRRTVGLPGTGIYDVKKIKSRAGSQTGADDAEETVSLEMVPSDQAPEPQITLDIPPGGAVLELPEGINRVAVVPARNPRLVSANWRTATILVSILAVLVLLFL